MNLQHKINSSNNYKWFLVMQSQVLWYFLVKKTILLARNLGSQVVGAHANIGRVGGSIRSIGNGMAKSSVGSSNSTMETSIAKTNMTKTSIAKTSIAKTSIAETSIAKTSIAKTMVSIRISISTIKNSSLGISISLRLALLATTWDRGSQIVSADSNIGGVGQASGGSNHSVSKSSISKTSISKTVISSISQTMSISKSVRISISTVESISFSLWSGISITLSISYGSIRVAGISQGSSSTGHRYVSTVHTWGGLPTESMETIGKGGGGSQELRVSFAVHGSNKGRCDNKELIHFVR